MGKHFLAGIFLKILALTLTAIFLICLPVYGEGSYPQPTGAFFVNDYANALSPDVRAKIAGIGKSLESQTRAQVVLVTIDTLNGQDIESYSMGLATKWGIGQKGKDSGVLILYANSERELRIEVGYGLEGALPDIKTAEIRENYIKPYTKNNDFNSGLLNGYTAVVQEVAREYGVSMDTPEAQELPLDEPSPDRHRKNNVAPMVFAIIFLIADAVFFRFRITSTLIKILFWSSFFKGGKGGWGGGFGGGSSGGGGSFGGGGSSGKV